jgi:integrase
MCAAYVEKERYMPIKKIGHGKYFIKVSKRDRKKGYAVSKQKTFVGTQLEAVIAEADLMKKLEAGSLSSVYASTFGEAADIYLAKLRTSGRLSRQHEDMAGVLRRDLGHIRLENFADQFELYRRHLIHAPTKHGKQRGSASVNRYTAIASAAFNHLVALGAFGANPITRARFPWMKEKPRDRFLTQEEKLRLLSVIRERRPFILPIIRFMLSVPCRVSELILARREQYDPINNVIHIPDSKAGIPLCKPVLEEDMAEYFRNIPDGCAWLFYRVKLGKYYDPLTKEQLRCAWEYCLKAAGISDFRIHDLRHEAATYLYSLGIPERVIMDIAGWKTPMLTTYRNKNSLRSAQEVFRRFRSLHNDNGGAMQFGAAM